MKFYIAAPTWPRFLFGMFSYHLFWILIGYGIGACTTVARGAEFRLLDVDELSMEYFKYREALRDPYFINSDGTPMQFQDGAALNMNLRILDLGLVHLYSRNYIHMGQDTERHVKHVGWEWENGIGTKYLDAFLHHHSRHGLEYINPRGDRFPVEDTYGVRLKLINRGSK